MYATTCMGLKNIKLSERIQMQKVTYCPILFVWNVQKDNSVETESRLVVAWSWR